MLKKSSQSFKPLKIGIKNKVLNVDKDSVDKWYVWKTEN
jgi:hypothetical protein